MRYLVNVCYSSYIHGWGSLDKKFETLLRKESDGAGTNLQTGWRDIDFNYKQKAAADRAVEKIKALELRGVKVKVYVGED